MKQRILSILNYKKPAFWAGLLGVVAFFFVAVCLVTSPVEEMAPVIVEVPVNEFTPSTPEEVNDTVVRIQDAWDAILDAEQYHLFFMDRTFEGSVGWQANFYKDGEDTLWSAYDQGTEEGHMVLDGVSYKYIDGSPSGWVAFEETDTMLDSMLEQFSLEEKVRFLKTQPSPCLGIINLITFFILCLCLPMLSTF